VEVVVEQLTEKNWAAELQVANEEAAIARREFARAARESGLPAAMRQHGKSVFRTEAWLRQLEFVDGRIKSTKDFGKAMASGVEVAWRQLLGGRATDPMQRLSDEAEHWAALEFFQAAGMRPA
jgi:hypothetical protein